MIDVLLRLWDWTYSEPARKGQGLHGGWIYSEIMSRELVGSAAAQAGRMPCCAVHLHFLGREHNLGLKSFNYYPSPRPLTPQCGETCRNTVPIGTSAEGRHTHIQHMP